MYLNKLKFTIKNNKGEIIYLLAQYSTPIVTFVINILVMRLVGPETIGIHQSIIIWGSYLSFLQLGVFNGLNRNLAYYKGAGKVTDIKKAVSTGMLFTLSVSFTSLIIVYFISKTSINTHNNISYWAFLLLGVSVFITPINTFLDTLYRTGQDFKKLGKFILIENALLSINSFMMVIGGYIGYVFQCIINLIVGSTIRSISKIKEFKFTFSIYSFKEQISTGFPILLNSYLYSTFFIFDQFYIINNFEKVQLGYYNLARLVLFLIPIIPNSLTTIFYPKASMAYGQSGNKRSVLKPFFLKALYTNVIIVVPLIILVYFLISPIVKYFLPQYIDGIQYAKLSVLGGFGYIFIGPSVILGVLKKNTLNFIFLSLLSISTYGLYMSGLLKFSNIESLIWYKNIIFICYTFLMIIYIYKMVTINEKSI